MKLTIRSIAMMIGLGTLSTSTLADDLLQIYQLAQEKDTIILQSQAQRDAAFEKINQARSAQLPQVNLSGDLSFVESSYEYADTTSGSATLGFSKSLYSKLNWINLSLSEKSAAQQEALYGYQQQNLIIRTTSAYFNVLRAIDNLSFVQANKAASARQLEQTKQRFDVGLTAITDVHEAQAEFDRTLAQEVIAENALDNSYESLRELTGVEHRDLNQLNTETFDPRPVEMDAKEWLELANDRNLQLNAMRISKEMATEQMELSKTAKVPTISLTGGLNSSYTDYRDSEVSDNYSGYDEEFTNSASVGLEFSVPLYTGGNIESLIKEAQINYVAATQALEQTYRSIQSQLNSARNNVKASIGSIQAYRQTVLSSESALQATEAGFDVGTRTIVDVQNATRSLYQAKQELASVRYDYILNMLLLKQMAGTLSDDDLMAINQGLEPITAE